MIVKNSKIIKGFYSTDFITQSFDVILQPGRKKPEGLHPEANWMNRNFLNF